jgi:hypothetical protein
MFLFKLLAVPIKAIFGTFGVFVAAILNAFIVSYIMRALAWNGVVNFGNGAIMVGMVIAFVLTFIASGSK